jgi:hypothetical protein
MSPGRLLRYSEHAEPVQRESVCVSPLQGLFIYFGYLTQGFGRYAASGWAVLSRAFSAYGDVWDQPEAILLYALYAGSFRSKSLRWMLPLRHITAEARKARRRTAQGEAKRNPG